jgi:membrane protein
MTVKRLWQLITASISAWVDDYAPSMGAALAYYTVFSLAPLLLIVIAVAGMVFGQEAAQGEIFGQIRGLVGEEGAVAVEGLLKSASQPASGILGTLVGVIMLVIGATTVFAELQSALDRIWRIPVSIQVSGVWHLVRTRLLSFGMVLGVGFLLLISLVVSAGLAAFGRWWSGFFGGWEALVHLLNFMISFVFITALFAMLYKFLPRVTIAWSDVWIGAAVTALLFNVGKLLIGLYLGKMGVSSGFGAAGSIVVLLIWVYYAAQIFLLGAEFTWLYARDPEQPEALHGAARSIPSRSRDVGEVTNSSRLVSALSVPDAYRSGVPTTKEYASARAVRKYVAENPLMGLGMATTLGLALGWLLRQNTPPDKNMPRLTTRRFW